MIKPIPTKAADGTPNGFVLPIWNSTQSDYTPKQIYATTVLPGCSKGPHLHNKRMGMFICVRGDVKIITRTWGTYAEHLTGEAAGFNIVRVPAGMAALIVNVGEVEAIVLNMPNPAWTMEDPDDCPVVDWDYKP